MTNQHQAQIEQIAKAQLGIETLASRNSDSLDFYDLGVGGIKAALEAAFKAGQAAQVQKRPAKNLKNAPESFRKYVECGNRIDALLERLNGFRVEHADRAAADAQNWGYLGDLGSVEQLIGQATEYIGGPMT